MINSRDSYTNFHPSEKYSIEFPYMIGTIVELKTDSDILAKICQYRIVVKDYKRIINVGLTPDIRSLNTEVEREITVEELEEKWKKTDRIIIGQMNTETFLHIGMPNQEPLLQPSSVVPSNDSENIAELLESFDYDPSKSEEVQKKYEDLVVEVEEQAKSLKLKK